MPATMAPAGVPVATLGPTSAIKHHKAAPKGTRRGVHRRGRPDRGRSGVAATGADCDQDLTRATVSGEGTQ